MHTLFLAFRTFLYILLVKNTLKRRAGIHLFILDTKQDLLNLFGQNSRPSLLTEEVVWCRVNISFVQYFPSPLCLYHVRRTSANVLYCTVLYLVHRAPGRHTLAVSQGYRQY